MDDLLKLVKEDTIAAIVASCVEFGPSAKTGSASAGGRPSHETLLRIILSWPWGAGGGSSYETPNSTPNPTGGASVGGGSLEQSL